MEPVRFVLDSNEPDCRLGVGWLAPASGQPGVYWFALVERGTNEVRDANGKDGELPTLDDLVEATRYYLDWTRHRHVHTQLREAALASRPADVQALIRKLAA